MADVVTPVTDTVETLELGSSKNKVIPECKPVPACSPVKLLKSNSTVPSGERVKFCVVRLTGDVTSVHGTLGFSTVKGGIGSLGVPHDTTPNSVISLSDVPGANEIVAESRVNKGELFVSSNWRIVSVLSTLPKAPE